MVNRTFWFAAGAGAGAYVVVRARRLAEAVTPDGLRDRLSGLGAAAQVFADEVRTGMAERDAELRREITTVGGTAEALPPATTDAGGQPIPIDRREKETP